MARFLPLYSSSSGNSSYLASGQTALLIDAGVGVPSLGKALQAAGVDPAGLQGVVLTHEHIDHIKGIRGVVTRWKLPVYASAAVLDYLIAQNLVPADAILCPLEGTQTIGDLQLTSFATPHDSVGSFGFAFALPDGRRVGIATDLGQVTEQVDSHLLGCDLVMLESNYDEGMLACCKYPYPLKRRIRSQTGHLSNADCANQLVRLAQHGSTRFVLCHLSRESNLPQLAAQTVQLQLQIAGLAEKKDYLLQVAAPAGGNSMMIF